MWPACSAIRPRGSPCLIFWAASTPPNVQMTVSFTLWRGLVVSALVSLVFVLKSLGLYTLLRHLTPTFQKSLFSFSSLMTQEAPAQSSLSGTEDVTDRNSGLRNTETRYAGLHKDWWRPILADLPDCWSPWFQILSFAQPSACLLSPRSQVCPQSFWAPQPWRALTPLENAQLPSLSFGGFLGSLKG